jgi:hypothetical protein
MRLVINTRLPGEVEAAVHEDCLAMNCDDTCLGKAFQEAVDWFEGRHDGYQAIDARYHDLEHTLQGGLCLSRLLRRPHELGHQPAFTPHLYELSIRAMLLHDTGYLKKTSDTDGSGAKYTLEHVDRSMDFAAAFLKGRGFTDLEIASVRHMIGCTGVNAKVDQIPFKNNLERIAGCALGTADLLGQMAAPDYIEKLPILYSEFEETARYHHNQIPASAAFANAMDLMRKTPVFWEKGVLSKFEREFGGLHRLFSNPYPDGPNDYIDKVNANIARLRRVLTQNGAPSPHEKQ